MRAPQCFAALPEAHRLREMRWQLFVTLTFKEDELPQSKRLERVFAWLRDLSKESHIYFKRLLWVLRFERGSRNGRGHYHLCIAGIPSQLTTLALCRAAEAFWHKQTGARAEISLYDPTRDGVGYVLKRPTQPTDALEGHPLKSDDEDCIPTLSVSLFDTFRRGANVRRGASRTRSRVSSGG